ncbi:MAG: zf-HC2 domain-containing protein [Anaerolineae bacterium]|nr:zf-HC2 domain-containing protein [Anaerolineae bacterium]
MVEGCIAPGEIKEGDLVAYLEGAASAQVRRHIAGCAACAAEIESLRQVDSMLTAVFRRANGPVFTKILAAQPDLFVSSPPSPQPAKVGRLFKLTWPEFDFQKISWARMALVLVLLLVFGGILVAVYDGAGQIWNQAAQTARVTAEATADLVVGVTAEVVQADPNWEIMNDNQPSTSGQAIVENPAAIAPPPHLVIDARK